MARSGSPSIGGRFRAGPRVLTILDKQYSVMG